MKVPPGWGEDDLSAFVEQAQRNTHATFANLRKPYLALQTIDDLFSAAHRELEGCERNFVSCLLCLRTHSSFRGAARLAMSGQLPEAYALMRSCLENALYSVYVHDDEQRALVWLNRMESEGARRESRSLFTHGKVIDHLRLLNDAVAQRASKLYDTAIDYGAHPNMASVLANVSVTETQESGRLDLSYLTGDSTALRFGIKTCAQVGVSCLEILSIAFQREFGGSHILQRAHEVAGAHGL